MSQSLGHASSIWSRGQPLSGDFGGDARDDIVFAWRGPAGLELLTLLSNGPGTWSANSDQLSDGDELWSAGGPVAGDVNHDGLSDLTFAFPYRGKVVIRSKLSAGNGEFLSQERPL